LSSLAAASLTVPLHLEQLRAEGSDPDDDNDNNDDDNNDLGDMANDSGAVDGPTVLAHVELAKTSRMSIHNFLSNLF
jgi:hypothetical protein